MTIVFLLGAEQDFMEATSFYDAASPKLGDFLVEEVEQTLNVITENPLIGRSFDDTIRVFPVGRFPFDIVYIVEPDRIVIVAVAHQRRHPDYWSKR